MSSFENNQYKAFDTVDHKKLKTKLKTTVLLEINNIGFKVT